MKKINKNKIYTPIMFYRYYFIFKLIKKRKKKRNKKTMTNTSNEVALRQEDRKDFVLQITLLLMCVILLYFLSPNTAYASQYTY